jgi:hypothetical protein
MAGAWTENGPISLPSRPLAYTAGAAILIFALAGVGMGFQASFRRGPAPDAATSAGLAGKDDTIPARPIVDLAAPTSTPEADKADNSDDEDAKAAVLAAQTAQAQAIQAKPAAGAGDIDTVMASPTEKPAVAAKAPTDETPPGTPVKSDVPF